MDVSVKLKNGIELTLYVATPEMRATYMKAINPSTGAFFTENEADYWGTISQIDMAVGRVRALLAKHGVSDKTWVSITADNGPEVNPAGGQGTGTISGHLVDLSSNALSVLFAFSFNWRVFE